MSGYHFYFSAEMREGIGARTCIKKARAVFMAVQSAVRSAGCDNAQAAPSLIGFAAPRLRFAAQQIGAQIRRQPLGLRPLALLYGDGAPAQFRFA